MRIVKGLIPVIAAVLCVSACSREGELKGDVFIVTKGAQNIKLGLVEVSAIPEDKVKQFVESKKAAIKSEWDKLQLAKDESKERVQSAQKAYDDARALYEALSTKSEKAKERAHQLEIDAMAEGVYLAPQYDKPSTDSYRQGAIKLQVQADAAKKQAEALEAQLQGQGNQMQARSAELSAAQSEIEKTKAKLLSMLTPEFFLTELPAGSVKATTDAEGKFSIRLPDNKRFALAAHGQRKVFDSTEKYFWLIWVSLDGEQTKQVMLTNQNLIGEDSPDSVFQMKELLPSEKDLVLRRLKF